MQTTPRGLNPAADWDSMRARRDADESELGSLLVDSGGEDRGTILQIDESMTANEVRRELTHRTNSETQHVGLVAFEALSLSSHLAVPKFDVPHGVTTDNGAILENRYCPHDSVLALELIDRQAVDSTPDAHDRSRRRHVETADGRVGAASNKVGVLWCSKMRRKG